MFRRMPHAVICAVILLVAGPAVAQSDGDAGATEQSAEEAGFEELTERAEEHFTAGEYEAAVALLERAYEIEKDPTTLFNLAHVLEQKGDLELARAHFEEFAMRSDVDLAYREEAASRAKILRDIMDSRESGADTSKAQAADSESTGRDVILDEPRAVSPWRPVGFGTAVVGLAGLGVGAIAGISAVGAERDFRNANTLEEARPHGDKARTLAALADTLFISGGVLTITGAVIAATTYSLSPNEKQSALRFEVGPNRVGATWGFVF